MKYEEFDIHSLNVDIAETEHKHRKRTLLIMLNFRTSIRATTAYL